MLRRTLMLAFTCALVAQPAAAAEYFVSPSGNDTAAGTLQAPWRTVAKVNAASLAPGDVVRFAGGAVFSAMLAPKTSGTAAAPIVFGTYGTGRAVLDGAGGNGFAGIAVNGRSSLVFEHLAIRRWTADGQGVYLSGARSVRFSDVTVEDSSEGFHQSPGAPSTDVAITGSRISRIAGGGGSGVGINVTSGSSGWQVTDTVIEHVADSCVIDQGANSVYDGVTATDCGFGGITYGTHGLYLKGPRQTLRNSTVRGAYTNCVSVRFQDATVSGNTLSSCPIGIAWFEYATAAGIVTIVRNRISDVQTGIYVDSSPTQSFRVSHNTIVGGRRNGATTEGIVANDAARLAVTNNIVTGALHKVLDVDGTAASAYTQRGNVLHGAAGASYVWNGKVVKSAAALATLSGQGAGDRDIDARLGSIDPAATDFRLAEDSPARDTGVRDPAGLTVEPGCDGAANHYCGSAPEPGAIELAGDGIGSTSTPDNGVVTRKADPAAIVVDPPVSVVASVRGLTATITWRAPKSGAAAYIVSGAGVATTTVKTPRAVIGKLRAGSTYTVRVTTVDRAGNRSAAASIRVRVAPALRASQVRPRIVSRTRTSILIRIPKAVHRGTLRVAGRTITVHKGLVRVKRLAAHTRYVVRLAVPRAGQTPMTVSVSARTR